MAAILGPYMSVFVTCAPPGSCVGGAGALASSLRISLKGITLGFVGGAGLGYKLILYFSAMWRGVY